MEVRRRTATPARTGLCRGQVTHGSPVMWTAIAYLVCSAFVGLLALTERGVEGGE
jgi:hypothetical protein